MERVAIVSCDIVSHARADHGTQRSRVQAINDMVGAAMARPGDGVVWASGGDGGHVAFRGAQWHGPALALIRDLHQWAATTDTPLRVTAHCGDVSTTEGADGRAQLVGDGINFAGALLELGQPEGVLASHEFVSGFDGREADASFHDPRWLQLPNAVGSALYLLSMPPEVVSRWGPAFADGDPLLADAERARDGWEVLYCAKRLMQLNAADKHAERAIRRLSGGQLRCSTPRTHAEEREPNPFLGSVDGPSRVELVRGAALVERNRGEVICRHGDAGDIMFVVLRGTVGVFLPGGDGVPASGPVEPAFTLTTGDVVGELAFALQRERTATLIALSHVALLGFKYGEIESRLRGAPLAAQAVASIERFVTLRVLENLYQHEPGLVPAEDPEWASQDPVEARMEALETVLPATGLMRFNSYSTLSLDVLHQFDATNQPGGIYILASGLLRSEAIDTKQLSPAPYRLLYVDLPEILVTPGHTYVVERPAVIIQIRSVLLAAMQGSLTNYLTGLRRSSRHCYYYDAFLSYAFHDEELVRDWQQDLEALGLRVFRDEQRIGHKFPERLEVAIRDSLTLVAFVSANTMVRPPEENWVRREVEFREQSFEHGNAAIIPVALPGGRVEVIASGHTPVDATGHKQQALDAVVQAIRRIRDGEEDPPYGRVRRSGLRLAGAG